MGLTERHWFEDEEPDLTDRQLEDAVYESKKETFNANLVRWKCVGGDNVRNIQSVIDALQDAKANEHGCIRITDEARCAMVRILMKSAELLKEQPKEGKWIVFPENLAYEGASSDEEIVCSACGKVWNMIDNCTEDFDYCPKCGSHNT